MDLSILRCKKRFRGGHIPIKKNWNGSVFFWEELPASRPTHVKNQHQLTKPKKHICVQKVSQRNFQHISGVENSLELCSKSSRENAFSSRQV
jgi:hypothetical protein